MRRTTIGAWMLTLALVGCDTTPPPPPPGAEDAELKLDIESGNGEMGTDGEAKADDANSEATKDDAAPTDEAKPEEAPAAKKDE